MTQRGMAAWVLGLAVAALAGGTARASSYVYVQARYAGPGPTEAAMV